MASSTSESDWERRPLLHRNLSRRNSRSPRDAMSPASSLYSINSAASNSSNHRTGVASAAILLTLVFERIAFYGLSGNLVLFLNKDPFKWESYHAIDASLFFLGLSFVTSLVGGWLADSLLGRFKALILSFGIYLAGFAVLPFMTPQHNRWDSSAEGISMPAICHWPNDSDYNTQDEKRSNPFDERCAWLIFLVLTIIAVGTGFVKANIAPFGCDQVAREGQQATLSFFNWFYWSVNVGALLGMSVITYLQQQHTFFIGDLVSLSCLAFATLLFIAGRCFYRVRPPDGSVLTNILRILREAWRRKRQRKQQAVIRSVSSGRGVDDADSLDTNIGFLDYAKHRHGGIFHDALVDDVKELKKIFAVFAVLIPYWLVYFQMQTTFLIQGLHMRLMAPFKLHMMTIQPLNNTHLAAKKPQLVAAWFSLFDVVMVIFLLPLFDRIIYPWIERRSGMPVSISRRILLGMIFATAAMVTAGVVEHVRLSQFWPNASQPCVNASVPQVIGNTTYEAADMSILWQIPQYALLGLSEVFTSVAGLQFAVLVAPRSMKGIIMGLFYLFSGFGSLLGTAIIASLSAAKVWFQSSDFGDINCRPSCRSPASRTFDASSSCHLDYFFFLLAGLEVLGMLLFLLVARCFSLDRHHRHSRRAHQLAESAGDFLEPARRTAPSPHRQTSQALS